LFESEPSGIEKDGDEGEREREREKQLWNMTHLFGR